MTLLPGSRLGPYEVLAPLGAGGMGEVYRAKDTRLGREVAVKVLPSHLSKDPERRERFEREAKAISSLSHPHICALHDVGREGEADYLVMELLEGETLQDRLARGALPPEQVMRYGSEIGDALDAAHRKGLVHRDLKPGNIMLTKSGVKVLDFGLARGLPSPGGRGVGGEGLSALPTAAGNLTQEGTILGTFQYMAPEQLEGKPADARTDIFALGTVLYEMATGRKAFSGATQASLIAAILERNPPLVSSVQPMTPPSLERAIRSCLAKDPEERWQNARDLANELRWISEAGAQTSGPPAHRKPRERFWMGATLVLLAATAGLLWLRRPRTSPTAALMRLSIAPPEKTSLMGTLALSPDGRRLALVATDASGTARLWIRAVDSLLPTPVADSDGAHFPFWSPDGRYVGFFAEGKLRKVAASGGIPQTLCDISDFRGGSWSVGGDILFSPGANDPLYRVADTGGRITPVTSLTPRHASHRWPVFLPDGRRFVFLLVGGHKEASGIFVGSLDTKELKRLVSAVSAPAFAPPGYLLYLNQGALVARVFDPGRGEVSGDALPVAADIWWEPNVWGLASYSVSATGLLAYRRSRGASIQLTWFDRDGKNLGAAAPPAIYNEPWLSPDEKRVAVGRLDHDSGAQNIWALDLARGSAIRLTSTEGSDQGAVWSPDGANIVYARIGSGIFRRSASGTGPEQEVLAANADDASYPADWSLDGRVLIYERTSQKTKYDIWALDLQSHQTRPVVVTEFNEAHSQLSPDGRYLAYTSDDTGHPEVYVQDFPGPGNRWPISSGGGDQPRWRRDGKELFFIGGPSRAFMAVDVSTGPKGFGAGIPKKLFSANLPETSMTGARNNYFVADQGRRFLVTVNADESPNIEVVVNWPAALGQR